MSARRLPTVHDLRALKGQRQLTMLRYFTLDEARAAEAAGIDVATSLESGPVTMIGGEGADGTSFSFTATRQDAVTEAQLSIGRGLE